MSRTSFTGALAAVLVFGSVPTWAQHEGHTMPSSPVSGVSTEQVTACVQSQQQVMALVDAANQRIEMARQSNEVAAMRAAVDDVQATLSGVRSQLASCAQLAAAAPATDPHAGHVMPSASQGDLIKDPRCQQDVDPKTAPQASHEGRTYYFCSESERQRFAVDPARYLQAAPAASATVDPHAGHTTPSAAPTPTAPAQTRPAAGTSNLAITFRTVPSPPRGAAENEFEVTVKDAQGKPVDGADVSIGLFMPAMPAMKMPEMRGEVKLAAAGNGRYTGKGQVMMAGSWTVTVTVRQNGKEIGQQRVTLTAK